MEQARVLAYNIVHEKVAGIPTLILSISCVWPQVLYKQSNIGKEVDVLWYTSTLYKLYSLS